MSVINKQAMIPSDKSGLRLDQAVAEMFPEYSRSKIKDWIISGQLLLNQQKVKPTVRLLGGESLQICATLEDQGDWQAEDIPLNIVYEDDQLIVINKPSELVVHPAAGNWQGTLLNGLLFRWPQLSTLPRAGIVHRLDKDTSGLMVVAKTLEAQTRLVDQLQNRTVKRVYFALAVGELNGDGIVEANIGRHPAQRTKMAVVPTGKPAITHYSVTDQYCGFTGVILNLQTGRTHQIRVHMAHLGYPLVGDPLYGKKMLNTVDKTIREFPRQALHASSLGLIHPKSGEMCQWSVPLADDIAELKQHLEVLFWDGLDLLFPHCQ